jgi:hypothetical protein
MAMAAIKTPKAGGYHCHRGPLAGEVFASSKAETLERLKRISSTVEAAPDKRRR